MKGAGVAFLLAVALSSAQESKTFTGIVSDEMCAKGDHSQMKMGSNDAECAIACVSAHGAAFVLWDGKDSYKLSGTQPIDKFAGQKARVVGALDASTQTIRVESITPWE
jgi:hypothetical protein